MHLALVPDDPAALRAVEAALTALGVGLSLSPPQYESRWRAAAFVEGVDRLVPVDGSDRGQPG